MKPLLFHLALLGSPFAHASLADKPLKILVLYADDWRCNTLNCAGNPVVKTSQIDKLATEGVRFTHSCVTTAICGVSRASLFTGQWMSRHGNKGFTSFKTPWAETYPGLLRANGYFVGHVGKWHNGTFPAENFDFRRSYSDTHWMTEPDGTTDDNFVLNVDPAPTILGAAGINAPPRMQGRDIAPLYLDASKPAWRDEFFYEHAIIRNKDFIPASQALVRKDMKYMLWPDFDREQLFDLKTDPFEENDVINDPGRKETLARMRARFSELQAEAR